jgi:hypothetical protein
MDAGLKIVKVGAPSAAPPRVGATRKASPHDKKPKHGILKHGKTARKTPRFEAVRDPAKPPPMKKGKLRILTSKGESTRRSKILKDAKTMPLAKIKETLRARGLPVSSKREDIIRTIYADAMQAGMLSSG